jgi:UDP-N-acetylglucosamine 2-epimerase (non-hydrolysing)
MNLTIVIGTRPNVIKVTQFKKMASLFENLRVEIVHTGQHYDRHMSGVFLEQFGMEVDRGYSLVGNSPAEQFGNMVAKLGSDFADSRPDAIMVPGDVNSTLAAALAANKMDIPIHHLEAGLRSFDRTMPEEINRILVDQLSSQFYVTEESGIENLHSEGLTSNGQGVHLVGNTMIDTLVAFDQEIQGSKICEKLGLGRGDFILLTMHRPGNVDSHEGLSFIKDLISELNSVRKVVFPLHPRTKAKMEKHGIWQKLQSLDGLILTEPLDYFSFQKLISFASVVVTDSGGIQEETTYRQVQCVTIRPNTERPVTVEKGTNQLVGNSISEVLQAIQSPKKGEVPRFWDGQTTKRILSRIMNDS